MVIMVKSVYEKVLFTDSYEQKLVTKCSITVVMENFIKRYIKKL
jgi:hypothetical protein